MGKKINVYLNDELIARLQNEPNVSGLISELLNEFYGNNTQALIKKKEDLEDQLFFINKKLERIDKTVEQQEKEVKELEKIKQIQEEEKVLIEKWKECYRKELITEEFYFMGFDDKSGEFMRTKLKELGKI